MVEVADKNTGVVQRPGEVRLLPFNTNLPWYQELVVKQLKDGEWRAYVTQDTNSGPSYPYTTLKAWAVRGLDDRFIQAPSLHELFELLKARPFFKYHGREARVYVSSERGFGTKEKMSLEYSPK